MSYEEHACGGGYMSYELILAWSPLRGCRPKASRRRPNASWPTRTQHRIVSRTFSMSPPLEAVNLKGVPGDDRANQQAREKEGHSGCESKSEHVRHQPSLSVCLSLWLPQAWSVQHFHGAGRLQRWAHLLYSATFGGTSR